MDDTKEEDTKFKDMVTKVIHMHLIALVLDFGLHFLERVKHAHRNDANEQGLEEKGTSFFF